MFFASERARFMPLRRRIAALALILWGTIALQAADTGTIAGAIFDPAGTPIADVTVHASGERLPVGRTTQTDANGRYQFEYLPPGEYRLEIDKAGAGRLT